MHTKHDYRDDLSADYDKNLVLPPLADPRLIKKDFDDFAKIYHKSMRKISKVIDRGNLGRSEDQSSLDAPALFLKGSLLHFTEAAISMIGRSKARSILRQVYDETRS